ncbi:hypothetical protein [Nocardioides sp. JQ2195]|uniref:hypothetical protein n=1 Tax=Nocardioides sp. JQ2195 TaxID=2592334 RepID=UPI001981C5D7|nr:hypothetical protein [Nocardioides sp. JQ2195]
MSIDNLIDWKPGDLDTVADVLIKQRKALVDLQDEIDDSDPPLSWASQAGDNARTSHEKLRLRLNDMVAEVSDISVSLVESERLMKAARTKLTDALALARTKGYTVDHATGSVTDPATYVHEVDVSHAQRSLQVIADDIGSALTDADDADAALAKALDAAAKGKVDGGDETLSEAAIQLPPSMDDLTQEELVELLGGDIAISTISAFLDAELEFATWELEGKAEAQYVVMADGTVRMSLSLEAGLGREIEVAGTEADVSAGGTTSLELSFDSPEEAKKFLDGLDDATLEFDGLGDFMSPGATVVSNVADYVMKQDITSFKVGVYGQGEVETDSPLGQATMSGRLDAYYDVVKEEMGIKVTGKLDVDNVAGHQDVSGAVELSGELTAKKNGDFNDFTLSGKIEASALNQKLGLDLPPGTSTGQGLDVELKVTADNPAAEAIKSAVARGDMDEATELAMENGRVVIRQTTIESLASEEIEFDAGVGGAEIEYGASVETANVVFVRPEGSHDLVQLDLSQLPAGK